MHEDAVMPQYAHGPLADAGMDLVAIDDYTLLKGWPTLVKTGLAIEIPPGFEGQVRSRSGLALKYGVMVMNSPGTIDPSYRGEIGVILINVGINSKVEIFKGDRIAQLVIAPYAQCFMLEDGNLSETPRGEKGFGSTGT